MDSMLDFGSLPNEYSLRLVLIRHGEPEQEIQGKCYGSLDIGLSEKGRSRVHAKLSSVQNFSAAALYASPLKRAIETAAIAGTCLGLQATINPELREINFGSFEGLAYSEIEQRYPREFKLWMEHPTDAKFPGGESFTEMKVRVLKFMEFLLSTHHQETVVIVSHGGPNRVILGEALGIPDQMVFRIDQAYAAINVIDHVERHPIVRLLNG